MVDRSADLGLAHEAAAHPVVLGQAGGDAREGHRAVERELRGPVDHAHSAPARDVFDPVAGERAACGELSHRLLVYRAGQTAAARSTASAVRSSRLSSSASACCKASGSGGNSWFGTAMTVMPAARAARMPLWESSTAAA